MTDPHPADPAGRLADDVLAAKEMATPLPYYVYAPRNHCYIKAEAGFVMDHSMGGEAAAVVQSADANYLVVAANAAPVLAEEVKRLSEENAALRSQLSAGEDAEASKIDCQCARCGIEIDVPFGFCKACEEFDRTLPGPAPVAEGRG